VVKWLLFLAVCFFSFIALLMQMLKMSGDNRHPCVTPLLVLICSEICPSIYLMKIFEFLYKLYIAFKSYVGMHSSLKICHKLSRFKLSQALS
jgi:hypothetical protein